MKYLKALVKYAAGRPLGSDIPLGEAIQNLRHENPRVRAAAPSWIGGHFGNLGMPQSEEFFTKAGNASHDLAGMPKDQNTKVSVLTEGGIPRVWLSHRTDPKMAISTFRDIEDPKELTRVLQGFADEGHIDARHVPMMVDKAVADAKQQKGDIFAWRKHDGAPPKPTVGERDSQLAKTDPGGKPSTD